jgi:hypothetical protein
MLLAVPAGEQALFDKLNAFRKGLQAVNITPDSSSDGTGSPTRLKPGNLALSADPRDYVPYYSPGYFHVFAQITGQSKWSKLADVFCTKLLAQQATCSNGQISDTFGATDCKIWNDSCRVHWRITADYRWFANARAKTFLDALRSGSVSSGTPGTATDQKNSAIIGAFAMSGNSSDNATMQRTGRPRYISSRAAPRTARPVHADTTV